MNPQADKCGGAQPRIIAIRSDGPTRSRRPDTLTDDCPELTVVAGRGGCDGRRKRDDNAARSRQTDRRPFASSDCAELGSRHHNLSVDCYYYYPSKIACSMYMHNALLNVRLLYHVFIQHAHFNTTLL